MSERSQLFEQDWVYFEKPMKQFTRLDWNMLNTQRSVFYRQNQTKHMLRLLSAMEHDPVFGYSINPYRHCLQSATKVYRDGHDLQTVVTALFHDVGFTVAPHLHGEFAATLLRPYISERNNWMLLHHGEFQKYYCHDHPTVEDRLAREQWRDHPHYEWTKEFVELYDQRAMDPNYNSMSLKEFEPIVEEAFSKRLHG